MCAPAAASTERVTNGNFDQYPAFTGWYYGADGGNPDTVYGAIANDPSEAYVDMYVSSTSSTEAGSGVWQNIDLTSIDDLTFDVRWVEKNLNGYVLEIYIDSNLIDTLNVYNEITSSWSTKSIDVSSYSGTHSINFHLRVAADNPPYKTYVRVQITGVSAIAYTTPVTVTSVSVSPNPQNVGNSVNISVSYTGGDPVTAASQSYVWFDFGNDWSGGIDLYGKTSPVYYVYYGYTTTGSYTLSAYGNHAGNSETTTPQYTTVTILPAKPAGISITVNPDIAEVNTQISFQASSSSGGSVNNWTWDFGDGSETVTTTSSTTTHTYLISGIYDVTATANGPGGSTSYTLDNAVTIGDTYVNLDKTTYYISEDTEIIANYSITPFSSANSYSLQFWLLDTTYAPISLINSIAITGSGDIVSGSQTFPINTITENGNYGIFLFQNDGYIAYDTTQVRYNGSTLTVNILSGNTIVSAESTVTLQNSTGYTLDTKTTNSGVTYFAPLIDGASYIVIVNATGYAQTSKTITITGDTTLNVDLGGAVVSGYGAQYEPISCSWLVYNDYGSLLPNATVTCVGVEVSTSIELLNKLYNFIMGETLTSSPQTLQTDSMGRVTFMVLPNTRYKLSVTYGSVTQTEYYNIGPGISTYTFTFTSISTAGEQNITSSVIAANGDIHVTYNDWLLTTSYIAIDIYDNNNDLIDSWHAPSNAANLTFSIPNYYNKEFDVIINATTSQGQYLKNYPIYFNGPRIDMGIPPIILTWIAIFATFAVGAAFTKVTASIGAMATSLFMWLMFAIGWFWQIEEMISTPTLVICLSFSSIVAILFMMAGDR